MFDIMYLLVLVHGFTPNETVAWVDWYVEYHTDYKFFYYKQDPKVFLKTAVGDCTDKAILKCDILRKWYDIPCELTHGYYDNVHDFAHRHDFYKYQIDGKWYSSEPDITNVRSGIW